jgi:hypothetical protein
MGNPVAEKAAFGAFLAAAPDFAGDAVQRWCQPKQDPPDVLCATTTGRQVGMELTEWLDQGQIAEAIPLVLEAKHVSPTPGHILVRMGVHPKGSCVLRLC